MLGLAFLLLAGLTACEAACHGSKTRYRAHFSGSLVRDDMVLLGHVIANFSVQNFTECSGLCKGDCRCRSFNLPMSGQGKCELNDADNTTALLKPLHGSRYHHLEKIEYHGGDDTCWEPYSNGCCSNETCENGGTCSETGELGKPGFTCACTTPGYFGQRCQRKIRSCLDYLWHDRASASGYYDIWKDDDSKINVYCDMVPEQLEAWTLVMSYDQSEKDRLKSQPLYVNYALNQIDASSGQYRLSLDKMQAILGGMDDGERDLEWKATCSFSFADGSSTSDDVVRSRFTTLDIMNNIGVIDKPLYGFYPLSSETAEKDISGYENHATFNGISYVKGPLGDDEGSVVLNSLSSSYIQLMGTGDKWPLTVPFRSLTIMMQILPYESISVPLMIWGNTTKSGVRIWQSGSNLQFLTYSKTGSSMGTSDVIGLGINMWNHIAVKYDYSNGQQSVFINGTRMDVRSVGYQELFTSMPLRVGSRIIGTGFNGRIACVRIYAGALSDQEIQDKSADWSCPRYHDTPCNRVDYINVRGHECYNCHVWSTQTSSKTFAINAHYGDHATGCDFNSHSTATNEKLFGVYDNADDTHACAASSSASTQYWFGGRL